MSVIGNFTQKDGKYAGTIKTMTMNVRAQLVPNTIEAENAPDWRVFSGNSEIGAGWKETSKDDRDYISIRLDDPSFPSPIYAAFFEDLDENKGRLVWNRSKPN